MSDRVFVDTNVLAYLFDPRDMQRQHRAAETLRQEVQDAELVISTQVLQELYVSLTKGKTPITTPEVAEQAVEAAMAFTVVQVDTAHVRAGIHLSRAAQLSFWDALILSAAASAGCGRMFTEDLNPGQTIAGVTIVNPFAG